MFLARVCAAPPVTTSKTGVAVQPGPARIFLLEGPRAKGTATQVGAGTPVLAADENSSFSPAYDVSGAGIFKCAAQSGCENRPSSLSCGSQERGVEGLRRWPWLASWADGLRSNQPGREIKGTFSSRKKVGAPIQRQSPMHERVRLRFRFGVVPHKPVILPLGNEIKQTALHHKSHPRSHGRDIRSINDTHPDPMRTSDIRAGGVWNSQSFRSAVSQRLPLSDRLPMRWQCEGAQHHFRSTVHGPIAVSL
jgi:hypothetical protein